jgi:hypothetical protein
VVKDDYVYGLARSRSILNKWKNYFCHVQRVNDVRQTEIHAAEPSAPQCSSFDVAIVIDTL